MDYIKEFDIRLEKEMYYAGELLSGHVVLDTVENFKIRVIRAVLRGKAHTEWKVIISGDRRTAKDDQYFIDDRTVIWGKEKVDQILPRGTHKFPFHFQLPESSLPCSFESKPGTIRYYIKVTVDIPYASPPQGMKYFTIIGPHIDCMDEVYLKPIVGERRRPRWPLCFERRRVTLRTQLERSAYVCGESLRLRADIDNQSEEEVKLKLKLIQYVEYYIDRGVLGVSKEVQHVILEYKGPPVNPHTRTKWDSHQSLVVSTMPPTLIGVCRLIQIYYVLKVNIELEKSGEDLHMHFPITIATVPFRIPNSSQQPVIDYEVASDHVEGGMYIGPEFQLGQVYDGTSEYADNIVLYRPVYICVKPQGKSLKTETPSSSHKLKVEKQTSGGGLSMSGKPLPLEEKNTNNMNQKGGGTSGSVSKKGSSEEKREAKGNKSSTPAVFARSDSSSKENDNEENSSCLKVPESGGAGDQSSQKKSPKLKHSPKSKTDNPAKSTRSMSK